MMAFHPASGAHEKKFSPIGNLSATRRVFTHVDAEAPTFGTAIGSCAIRGELRSFFFLPVFVDNGARSGEEAGGARYGWVLSPL
jgi:hypothetical protein